MEDSTSLFLVSCGFVETKHEKLSRVSDLGDWCFRNLANLLVQSRSFSKFEVIKLERFEICLVIRFRFLRKKGD